MTEDEYRKALREKFGIPAELMSTMELYQLKKLYNRKVRESGHGYTKASD